VSITEDGNTIASRISLTQKEHAGFIHTAIQELIEEVSIDLKSIHGIGVTIGPGSYTGLRVALATAKGFAYALSVPMVVTSTLEMMAYAAIEATNQTATTDSYFVPLIDARRMEVFTAVYNKHLQLIQEAQSFWKRGTKIRNDLFKLASLFFKSSILRFFIGTFVSF
jgi:tRNA threonylcarbamoyladenosine biosynthesis protein TsaB